MAGKGHQLWLRRKGTACGSRDQFTLSSRVLDFERALMAKCLVVRLMILQSSLKYNVKLRIRHVNRPIVVVGIGGAGLGNRQLGTRFELRTELPRARRRLCTQTRTFTHNHPSQLKDSAALQDVQQK
jgi:hypothetical protein